MLQREILIDRTTEEAARGTLGFDVLDGLTRPFKELPPKYFYDDYGSELFERICELPEYYPTRTERWILDAHATEIAHLTRAEDVVELGAGHATKTRVLLDALTRETWLRRYMPVDVSPATVETCVAELAGEYPGLRLHGLVGDFEWHLDALPEADGPRLIAFLGGTLGNFLPGSRRRFLGEIRRRLPDDGFLLLGTDLVKDRSILLRAYDDSAGMTAEFNRNILRVVNRELGANFDLTAFEHVALYDEEREWIEMRLRSRVEQLVEIPTLGLSVTFAEGEEIRTEISAKFTRERLNADLAAAGLRQAGWYADPGANFAVSPSRPIRPRPGSNGNQPAPRV
jgi:L-histidine N-alpha-methyltransferase